jgi:hypothetical protein
MRTGESLRATFSTSARTARIGWYWVMISGTASTRSSRFCSTTFALASCRFSQARRTRTSISAIRYGFDR